PPGALRHPHGRPPPPRSLPPPGHRREAARPGSPGPAGPPTIPRGVEMSQRRRSGGRAARQAARAAAFAETRPYLTRRLKPHEVLDEEGLATIEELADRILAEVGLDIVDYPEALTIFADHGAEIEGNRVRFPAGMCRRIIQESAPSRFTQHARNPERSVEIGDPHLVLAPAYGSP